MCKISLWSVEHIWNQSTSNFGQISNLIEILLVGQRPGHLFTGPLCPMEYCHRFIYHTYRLAEVLRSWSRHEKLASLVIPSFFSGHYIWFNSWWRSNTTWRHKSGSAMYWFRQRLVAWWHQAITSTLAPYLFRFYIKFTWEQFYDEWPSCYSVWCVWKLWF